MSKTLEGDFHKAKGDSPPNLYSFIGFDESPEEVIGPILQRLSSAHKQGPKMVYSHRSKDKMEYYWKVRAPDEEAIYNATPFPDNWLEGDVSWAQRIERGIPNIAHFLNVFGRPGSRSGGGVQVEGVLRTGGRFRPTSYLSQMFNNFLRRVAGRKDNGRSV